MNGKERRGRAEEGKGKGETESLPKLLTKLRLTRTPSVAHITGLHDRVSETADNLATEGTLAQLTVMRWFVDPLQIGSRYNFVNLSGRLSLPA